MWGSRRCKLSASGTCSLGSAFPQVKRVLEKCLRTCFVLFCSSFVGRIVQTVLPASYADEISIFDFNMRPGASVWPRPDCVLQPQSLCPNGTNPGRTYRFFSGVPVVPFGFGLSYTSFQYKWSTEPKQGVALPHYRSVTRVLFASTLFLNPLFTK
jgi:hypothetical protein